MFEISVFLSLKNVTKMNFKVYLAMMVALGAAGCGGQSQVNTQKPPVRYHFHPNAEDTYNPFGLMRALDEKEFKDYWFETGTPTFLVKEMKRNNMKLSNLDRVECAENDLSEIDNFANNPVPLLYQSGYLTIKVKRRRTRLL